MQRRADAGEETEVDFDFRTRLLDLTDRSKHTICCGAAGDAEAGSRVTSPLSDGAGCGRATLPFPTALTACLLPALREGTELPVTCTTWPRATGCARGHDACRGPLPPGVDAFEQKHATPSHDAGVNTTRARHEPPPPQYMFLQNPCTSLGLARFQTCRDYEMPLGVFSRFLPRKLETWVADCVQWRATLWCPWATL